MASETSWPGTVATPNVRGRRGGEHRETGGIQGSMAARIEVRMTCRELVDDLGEYVAGTLDADERTRLDAHLAGCASCLGYLRSYRDTIHLAKDAAREEDAAVDTVPADLIDAIVAAVIRSSAPA